MASHELSSVPSNLLLPEKYLSPASVMPTKPPHCHVAIRHEHKRMQAASAVHLVSCSSCGVAAGQQQIRSKGMPLRRCHWCREAAYCSPDCRYRLLTEKNSCKAHGQPGQHCPIMHRFQIS